MIWSRKPAPDAAPSNLAIIGRYVLAPEIFDALDETEPGRGGEIQLTGRDSQPHEVRSRVCLPLRGPPPRCRRQLGFLKATVEFALEDSDLGEPFRKYLSNLEL